MFNAYFCCRPAPYCCGYSPPTAVDTTEWMNLPVATFPPASCRYTHGEAENIWLFVIIYIKEYLPVEFIRQQMHLIEVQFDVHVEFGRSLILFVPFRMDATLKELTSLVKEVYPEARKKGTHFSFNVVYPDPRGKMYRLASYCTSTGWIHGALYIETCACLYFSDWKISAVLYLAGRAPMTPWRCSHSASRLETIWTSLSHRPIEPHPLAHAWGPSECVHTHT